MRAIVLGLALVFVVAGVAFGALGLAARGEVQSNLEAERLVVENPQILLTYPGARAPEGVEVEKVLINSPELADAEAKVIQTHVLAITGGKTYSEMDREDPARATYLNAVTLRSALMQARMAFDVSLLVMGLGGLLIVTGGALGAAFVLSLRGSAVSAPIRARLAGVPA